jgi:hypothetical protein
MGKKFVVNGLLEPRMKLFEGVEVTSKTRLRHIWYIKN